jgi:hypothetical protein
MNIRSISIILMYKTRKLSSSSEGNTGYLSVDTSPNNAFFEFCEESLKN